MKGPKNLRFYQGGKVCSEKEGGRRGGEFSGGGGMVRRNTGRHPFHECKKKGRRFMGKGREKRARRDGVWGKSGSEKKRKKEGVAYFLDPA